MRLGETFHRLRTLAREGSPITIAVFPGGEHGMTTFENAPDGSRTFVPYSTALAANPYDGYSFQRKNERWNAGGFASFEISDAAEVYANAMWFRDKSANLYPARVYSSTSYSDGPYRVSCANPYMSAAQAATMAVTISSELPRTTRFMEGPRWGRELRPDASTNEGAAKSG